MSKIPALFASLVDDAAVFPPAETPLIEAVDAHRSHRSAWYADFVGPLLCRASSLDELEVLVRGGDGLAVAVVVDTGTGGLLTAVDAVAGNDRFNLRGVEIPLRGEPLADNARRTVAALDAALGGPDDDEPAYVEIPRLAGWERALDVLAEAGYRAKFRTGGADASMYPSADELAAFIVACLDRGVAFKLTAGLHRAVRHTTSDGQTEHGFLNVILGVAGAIAGSHDDTAAALTLTDADEVRSQVDDLTDDQTATIRRWFASYGSCSVQEPLDDLRVLGLVAT